MSDACTAITCIGKPADPMLPDGCTFEDTPGTLLAFHRMCETNGDQPEPHQENRQ